MGAHGVGRGFIIDYFDYDHHFYSLD